jgi:hypothetical protein
MTDQELRAFVADLAASQKETDRRLRASGEETDRRMRESREETDRRMRESREETERQFRETERQFRETERQFRETDRRLRELGQQIGGLGGKFGSFTEGMALPSVEKILRERFGMDVIHSGVETQNVDQSLELDAVGWSRSRDEVYVVEIKSHLRVEVLKQMKKALQQFHHFFPGHEGKKVYGVLAAVHIPKTLCEKILDEGLYLARIHDSQFELQVPDGFRPRAF